MRILNRYLAVEVVRGTALVLLVLTAITAFFTLVAELDRTGGDYGVPQVLQYVLLTLPRRTYELLPSATLVGAMLSLGGLAASSELVVMRAAGVSLARIVWAVLRAGVAIMLLALVIGELIAPPTMAYAESRRAIAKSQQIAFKTGHGLWARDGRTFVNIRRVLPDGRLAGVSIYELDGQHRLTSVTEADHALYAEDRWLLESVRQSRIAEEVVTTQHAEQGTWVSLLRPDLLGLLVVRPEQLSALDLRRYIGYLRDNGLDTRRYEVAFWGKVVAPFSNLVMLLVAVPFVFGSLRSAAAGQRLVIGVLGGIGFYLLNQTFGRVGQVYELHPVVSAGLPTLLFLALAVFAIRRVR
jgi:lipopolysaccharide export system permease protein